MKYGICIEANKSILWIKRKSPATKPSFTHDPNKALGDEHYNLVKSTKDAIENARPLLRGKLAVVQLPERNPVPKSRAARMRKLSAAVAKAAAGSAYNKAKRKPRKLQYIARGTSKAAANAFNKVAKKLKLNPSQREAIRKAEELAYNFSGHMPTRSARVRRNDINVGFKVGELEGVMYRTVRDGETANYFHRFKKSSRPLLVANHDGSSIQIVGGRYGMTDRGIVDK